MAEVLSGYGNALSQIGKERRSGKNLDEALNLARELKNQALVAQTLNFQGDRLLYKGDFKSARGLLEQAAAGRRQPDRSSGVLLRGSIWQSSPSRKDGRKGRSGHCGNWAPNRAGSA